MSYFQSPTITTEVKSPYVSPGLVDEAHTPFELEHMIDEVCEAFGATKSLVMSHCKTTEEVFARWAIWKIMLSHGYSKLTCGKLVGGHHRTTVLNAMNQIDHDIEHTPLMKAGWAAVKKYQK
jgi:chromosomal replication initiation ATPase DnaA